MYIGLCSGRARTALLIAVTAVDPDLQHGVMLAVLSCGGHRRRGGTNLW